jgi:hypothetical protein
VCGAFPLDAADSWRDLEVIAGVFGVVDKGFGVIFAVLLVSYLFFEAWSSGESRSEGGSGDS